MINTMVFGLVSIHEIELMKDKAFKHDEKKKKTRSGKWTQPFETLVRPSIKVHLQNVLNYWNSMAIAVLC